VAWYIVPVWYYKKTLLEFVMLRNALYASVGGTGLAATLYHFSSVSPPVHSALQPNVTLSCPLLSKIQLTQDTMLLRFELPTPDHHLGLSVASHVLCIDNAMVYREYTPITLDGLDPPGYFELIVKGYTGGYFSSKFQRLKEGDSMQFRGPFCTMSYSENTVDSLGMVAAGTGITPMYQIIRAILANKNDKTKIALVYANKSEDGILLKLQLDALAAEHPESFRISYCVETLTSQGVANMFEGRVNESILKESLPSPDQSKSAVLVCGPPGMMLALTGNENHKLGKPLGGMLKQMGYSNDHVLSL